MDDVTQAQKVQTNDQPQPSVQQISVQSIQSPPTPSVPITPSGQKESAPIVVQDVPHAPSPLEASQKEVQLAPEVAEIGVEAVSEMPTLVQEHAEAGIELAKGAVIPQTQPSGVVQLPMTEEEALKIVKLHKKVADSIFWLATLVLMHIKKIHSKITSN